MIPVNVADLSFYCAGVEWAESSILLKDRASIRKLVSNIHKWS